MYIKLTNNTPEVYSLNQLYADNPNTSFPSAVPDTLLAEYGVYKVQPTSSPNHLETEVVEKTDPVQNQDGEWTQAWRVRPMDSEELAAIAQQKDEQRRYAYQAEADPIFFKWQREEATKEEWLAKITEIKNRFSSQ
jgi:hypothetical protein